jgi:hypothetical protein
LKYESDRGHRGEEEGGRSSLKNTTIEKILKVRDTFYQAAGIGAALVTVGGIAHYVIKYEVQRELAASRPAYEEKAPANNKFTIVFEGHQKPRCGGDIEKTVPQIDEKGELMALSVFCKPKATEPAQ